MRRNGGTVRDGRPRHTPRRFVPEGRCDDGEEQAGRPRDAAGGTDAAGLPAPDLLRRAYKADYRPEFTDDASVVEANGEQVTLCEGERTNIKITSPADLLIARILRHAGDGKETDSL